MVRSSIKHWLIEKTLTKFGEAIGVLPKGASNDLLLYSLFVAAPPGAMKILQYPTARIVAMMDPSGGFNPKYSMGTPSRRPLLTDTSGGRYRGPLPGSRPATVNYRVGRIGGGALSLPALNLGLGIMLFGTMQEFAERDSHVTDVY